MKVSSVLWAVLTCAVCFAAGWMLPSPIYDAVRYTSERQESAAPIPVEVFVDTQTGCEYVGQEKGALTPRLGADGKQVCIQESPAPR